MWARDSSIARNRFVMQSLLTLPFGHGRRWMNHAPQVLDELLGGWRLMWTTQLQQGGYFSPSFTGTDPSNTNSVGGLPDCVANPNLPPGQRIPTAWFNAAAFAAPPAGVGRFGNCGVNIIEGPGIAIQNANLVKQFRITERINTEFHFMVLDLFNSPFFNNPAANISVPAQVGHITSLAASQDPSNATTVSQRIICFRLRINF
jgi:hypothetical protein